jgi:hypothetical protein
MQHNHVSWHNASFKKGKRNRHLELRTTPQHIEGQTFWHHESECQRFPCIDEVGLLLTSKVAIGVDGEGPSMATL